MTETSSRLLELLSLLQGRRDWPGNELAERLEVSGRTIRPDVHRLPTLGLPERDGGGGPAGGRATLARQPRPPLVSRRLGPSPRRLAHLPRRPPVETGAGRSALHGARAPGEGCGCLRQEEHRREAESIR